MGPPASGTTSTDDNSKEAIKQRRKRMGLLSWRWWSRNKSSGETARSSEPSAGTDRRQLLQAFSVIAGSGALAAMPQSAGAKDASELPPPKRALTGRNE